MFVPNFMTIHSMVVETFQSWTKVVDGLTDIPFTLAANVAKNVAVLLKNIWSPHPPVSPLHCRPSSRSCNPKLMCAHRSSSCVSGSAADSKLLGLHHHRWPHRGHHHSGPHPHHHLLHGGNQTQLLRSLLVHPPPLHHLLRRSGLSRSRVRERSQLSFLFKETLLLLQTGFTRMSHPQAHCEESTDNRSTTQFHLV